jgi:hypothetical protein
MSVINPPDARDDACPLDKDPPHGGHDDHRPWFIVIGVVLVLGCAAEQLLTGHSLRDALLGAAGMALIGGQTARRILADAGPLPVLIVASAVTVFGAVLLTQGYGLSGAGVGAGIAGLVAGEIAGRMLGSVPRPWRGV